MTDINDEELKELLALKEDVHELNARVIALELARKKFEDKYK